MRQVGNRGRVRRVVGRMRASVTRGTTQNISIASTPSGAQADIVGLEIPTQCITPCVVQAKRNADITVTISKEGYDPDHPVDQGNNRKRRRRFRRQPLLGGVVGMGVDAATGAAQDHKPNPVIVTLQPVVPAPPPRRLRPAKRAPRRVPDADLPRRGAFRREASRFQPILPQELGRAINRQGP